MGPRKFRPTQPRHLHMAPNERINVMQDPDIVDQMMQSERQAEQEHEAALYGSVDAYFEDTLGPCGCVDYHMADCPLITDHVYEPDEGEF